MFTHQFSTFFFVEVAELKLALSFYQTQFNYIQPIIVSNHQLSSNIALHVLIKNLDTNQEMGFLELTALQGFHNYSIENWKYYLQFFFNSATLNFEDIDFNKKFFNVVQCDLFCKGELLFIVESILLKVLSFHNYVFYTQKVIKTNSLFSGYNYFDINVDVIKIKIRPINIVNAEMFDFLKIQLTKKSNLKIRFDGNRTFSLMELCDLFNNFIKIIGADFIKNIEYIEEPFINFNDIFLFKNYHPIPIAIDESIIPLAYKMKSFQNDFPMIKSLIIKPSLLGISPSYDIITKAKALKLNCVISSSYETTSALNAHLFLCQRISENYHGLDTLKFLPPPFDKLQENFCLEN